MNESSARRRAITPRPMVLSLAVLGALYAGVGLVVGVLHLMAARAAGDAWQRLWAYDAAVLAVAGGFAAAMLLWCLAWFAGQHQLTAEARQATLRAVERIPASLPRGSEHAAEQSRLLGEVLEQLRRLNTNTLMSEQQRQIKRQAVQTPLRRHLAQQIEAAIDAQDFQAAEAGVAALSDAVPDAEEVPQLTDLLAQRRQAAQDEQIHRQQSHIQELMSMAAFGDALASARQLAQRFPQAPAVQEFSQRVQREAMAFEAEQLRRLMGEIERHASARQWRRAAGAAQRLLEQHGAAPEAQQVRATLGTLQENARLEEARELRDRVRDLIERNRFSEAVEAAENLIERFPDTKAAQELSEQMARLRQRAASGE